MYIRVPSPCVKTLTENVGLADDVETFTPSGKQN